MLPKISLILIIVISVVIFFKLSKKQPLSKIDININNKSFCLEIAKSITQKSRGLSNRHNLCPNCGMIFVYRKESIYPFWMKNTLIPLDIIWINKDGQVVDIIQGKPKDLSILTPKGKALYIIELNKDMSINLNLNIGDQIQIPKNI